MKRFSLAVLALALVLCCCNEIADEENSLPLKSEEESRRHARGPCRYEGSSCSTLCECCGDDTDCSEDPQYGSSRKVCHGPSTTCSKKEELCGDNDVWKITTFYQKCRKE
nr:venom protein [Lampona murina]